MRKNMGLFTQKGRYSMDKKEVKFDYSDEEYEQIKEEWEKAINSVVDDSDEKK